jgi:hypothetical protein
VSDPHDLTIRALTLDGQWETLGADRYNGVVPENVSFSFNEFGPDICSFTLRRDASGIHPDLTTWTPIEVEVAGVVAWDGRLKETPTSDGDDPSISVQAEGWQYHLDDDVYAFSYAHTRLDFVDVRSLPSAVLSTTTQSYNVVAGDGQLEIAIPNGSTTGANTGGAAVIDLGPRCSAITVSIDVASSFNAAGPLLYVIGSDMPWWNDTSRADYVSGLSMTDASFVAADHIQTITASIAVPRRYITVMMFVVGGGAAGADHWFRVTGLRAFGSTSYQTAGVSTLKADTVIKHAVATAAPLLSTDISNVAAGTFSIPEFALDGLHSPREVLNAVNAYENYELKMLVGRRLYFQPRQTVPTYEIGEWSGADFTDASANSGDEIVNRVIVEGTGPDDASLSVERWSQGPTLSGVAQPTNPSATVNTSGWTVTVGTIVRSTAQFFSSPASFAYSVGPGATMTTVISQPLVSGTRYRVSMQGLGTSIAGGYFEMGIIVGGVEIFTATGTTLQNVWTEVFGDFMSSVTAPSFTLRVMLFYTSSFVDDITFQRQTGTLVDRRGFVRTKVLPVNSSLTITTGNRIADLYLAAHRTVPFKGGFQAVGQGGVRLVLGGATVHPAHLQVGALVRCSHRIDPDTGGWSRDGRVATVSYNHDALTSSVSLDENRAGLETLLSRLSVVVGGG